MAKDSLGIINWWGFTPALDFFENDLLNRSEKSDVNILLVGSGDSRHILKTISKLYQNDTTSINIYVIESSLELYARYTLQLIIGLISLNKMGLQEKTELFLELYGNSLVREQSMVFVRQIATTIIRLITDTTLCSNTLPFLDFSFLKFKERDILESVFKIWRDQNPKSFDASLCWDLRVRQNLGVRYDAIPNVFDWDCTMKLHDRGAAIIHSREYNNWRHKGVAFQLRDAQYDQSNRTLASGRVLTTGAGDKTARLGYWGDIVCSPYLAFGITSTNTDLFKKANNQYTCGASRVSEYNVTSMFHELAYGRKYMEKCVSSSSVTITEIVEEEEELEERGNVPQYLDDLIPVKQVKVTFLPVNALTDSVPKKEMFCRLFDLVYFSTSLVGGLETFTSLPDCLKDTGKVVIETPKFIVDLNTDQIEKYDAKIEEMCLRLGLKRHAVLTEQMREMAHLIYAKE